ncbi:MAG: AzlD domain-containing protein [Ruthenibacterium sp.]
MLSSGQIWLYIAVMAGVTYLIRMLPLALSQKKLKGRFFKSFLFYVPYAVLSAMAFPAILESTGSLISAVAGFLVSGICAYFGASLLPVALAACGTVYFAEWMMRLWA